MKLFLFQGDSITDASRVREKEFPMGSGYPTMVAGELSGRYPGEIRFLNRAISGNRSIDIYARIKRAVINYEPDYMSVLVGVNDVWHELENHDGVLPDKYERNLDMFLSETREALPDIRLFVLEPFCLHGTATDNYYEEFRAGVDENRIRAKRVAEKNGAVFVPLQERMNEMAAKSSPDYVLIDGVHPTWCGHGVIARALIEAFESIRE